MNHLSNEAKEVLFRLQSRSHTDRDLQFVQDWLENGFQLSYNRGREYGFREGHIKSKKEHKAEGYDEGKEDGFRIGKDEGWDEGWKDGHEHGYKKGLLINRPQKAKEEKGKDYEDENDLI